MGFEGAGSDGGLDQLRRRFQQSGGDPSLALEAATRALRLGRLKEARDWSLLAAAQGRAALPLMIESELPLFSLPESNGFGLYCDPGRSNSLLRLQSLPGQPRATELRRGIYEDAQAPHLSLRHALRPELGVLRLPPAPHGPLTAWDSFADRLLVGANSDSEGPWLAWQGFSELAAGENWRRIPILPGGSRIKEKARVAAIRVEGQGALVILEIKTFHAMLWIELGTGLRYAWASQYSVLGNDRRHEQLRLLSLSGGYAILFMIHHWRSSQGLHLIEIPSLRELNSYWHDDEYWSDWHDPDRFMGSPLRPTRPRIVQWQFLRHDDDHVLVAAGAGGLVAAETVSLLSRHSDPGPWAYERPDNFVEIPNLITEPERVVEAYPLTQRRALLLLEDGAYVRSFRVVSLP